MSAPIAARVSAAAASGAAPTVPGLTVFIDNYDSFSYNVVQLLAELGAEVVVYRNDAITVAEVEALHPARIVISPGPGAPKNAGVSCDIIRAFAGKAPIFGVCLGLQCMFEVFGGVVSHAGEIVHGKTSPIHHDGKGCFTGLPSPVNAVRYHSLAGRPDTLPACLEVTARTDSGVIQGVRHADFVIEGVQFHPESILTEGGRTMLANFLQWTDGTRSMGTAAAAAGATGADTAAAAPTAVAPAATA